MANGISDLDLVPGALGALSAAIVIRGGDALTLDPVAAQFNHRLAILRLQSTALTWASTAGHAASDQQVPTSVMAALLQVDPARFESSDPGLWVEHTLQYLANMLVFAQWSAAEEGSAVELGVGTAVATLRVEVLWGLLHSQPARNATGLVTWLAQVEDAVRRGSRRDPTRAAITRRAPSSEWRDVAFQSAFPQELRRSVMELVDGDY